MPEKDLVNAFVNYSKNFSINVLHIETNPHSKHMDCEFIFNHEYIRAEAKTFNDKRNSSQNFLKIFGGILKGRKLPLFDLNNILPVVYAALINEEQFDLFVKQKRNNINAQDWLDFGESFGVKYIFIVDDSNKNIRHINWNSI